ncbi:uncharacterized protein LOC9629684 [Selaginella moellendorffii]|uniref:uncharacterized protein LOC9629684 n=1 Tax=Selaginella moellendorffii TaxID=88036 RepID=UPI000D1C3780|nr:uncharacterized protein LOC9629684 [Selaginella moellendorffii]|eukprot:XP_024534453.1 uncharacterized protein LOC9629684 [Selaginella moellendorffii]
MAAFARVVAARHGHRFLCSLVESSSSSSGGGGGIGIISGSSGSALSTDVASKCDYVKALYGFTYGAGAAWSSSSSPSRPSPSDCRIRQAVAMALQNYLHFRRGVPLDDAVFISTGAPTYINSVVQRLRGAGDQQQQQQERSYDQVRTWVEAVMQKEGVDEMEPFLESIGMASANDSLVFPRVDLCGDMGLLRTAKAMEGKGIPKRNFWHLLKRNRQILHYSLRDCLDTVGILSELGLGPRELGEAVYHCPWAFRVELEEELRPVIQQLERLGVAKTVIGKIITDAPTRVEVLSQVNAEALVVAIQQQVGASKEAAIKMVRDDPAVLVGCNIAKLTQIVKYFKTVLLLEDDELLSLVTRFPRLLVLNLDKSVINKVEYLKGIGVQRAHAKRIILKNPRVLAYSLESNIIPKVEFLDGLGFRRKSVGALLCKCPQLLSDMVSTCLRRKANFLLFLGVKSSQLADIMYVYPEFMGLKLDEVKTRLAFYKSLRVEQHDLATMLTKHPAIMNYDINTQVKPVIEYFKSSLGFTTRGLAAFLRRRPSVLGESVEFVDEKVKYFEELGFRRHSDAFNEILVYAMAVPIGFIESRLERLRRLGITEKQLKTLVQVRMPLLYRDDQRVMATTEYLLKDMQLDMDELLKFPQFFGYDLEDRVKPRHRLVAWLKAKHIIKQDYPPCYLHMRRQVFEDMFLDCHPEARDIFRGYKELVATT